MAKQSGVTVVNNIELDVIRETKKAFQGEGGHHYVEKNIEGTYGLEGSPSFVAEIRSDMSRLTVASDEPRILGGRGVHASPLSYLLFGVMACFANSLAIQCSLNGVELERMKVKGRLSYDIGPVLTDIDSPLIKRLEIEVEADKDIREIIELTKARCPALYAIDHAVNTEVVQSGPLPPRRRSKKR